MSLTSIFQDIADAIRTKTGKSESIYPVDMASEIEGISSGGGYKLEKMPSGAISFFNDGTDLPLNKLKVSIEPVQDLHGYDHPWAGGAGKNKWSFGNITGTKQVEQNVNISVGTWTFSWKITSDDINGDKSLVIFYYNDDTSTLYRFQRNNRVSYTLSAEKPITKISFYAGYDSSQSTRDTFTFADIQLESGSTATSFAPYSNICPISGWDECNVNVSPTTSAEDGTTYTIQFKDDDNPLTVYGGTLDVTSGELTVTNAYIASYNAETLPSTWISDRDVYAEGTAPTTGAEVVYKLANSVTYHLTPVQIRTLVGNNNIWADTGDILNGEYFTNHNSSRRE